MKAKLAVIGASYLQLPLVIKAKELGLQTLCFAWDEGAVAREHCDRFYPISIVEKQRILEVCKDEAIDGICTIASDVAVPTVSFVAEHLGLVGNSIQSSRVCTNKYLMRNALAAAGVRCPRYLQVTEADSALLAATPCGYPLIVKPVDRSGSMGVTQLDCQDGLGAAVDGAIAASFTGAAIVEEFIEGDEVSVETISWEGAHFHLTITDKVTSGRPHFVELAHHQPTTLPESVQNEIRRHTCLGLDALGVCYGASHAEFIVSERGLYVTEIGARMGGDFIGAELVCLSTGYDFLRGVIEVSLGHFEEPVVASRSSSGVYFYSTASPEVLRYIQGASNFAEIVRAEQTKDSLMPLKRSADRSGYFIYSSDSRMELT